MKKNARIKISLAIVTPLFYGHLYSMDFCILWHSYITASHTSSIFFYIHHQLSVPHNPKMMSDSSLLFHSDLHPVHLVFVSYIFLIFMFSQPKSFHLFVLFISSSQCHIDVTSEWFLYKIHITAAFLSCFQQLHQSLRMSCMTMDTPLVRAYDSLSLDGSLSRYEAMQVEYITFFTFYIILIYIFIMHCFAVLAYISVLLFTAWFASFSFVIVSRSAIEFVLSSIAHHIWRKLMLTQHDTILGCL